jgi:hypothetical protein
VTSGLRGFVLRHLTDRNRPPYLALDSLLRRGPEESLMAPQQNVLRIPRGYRSAEAASFLGQLDDLTEVMAFDTRGIPTKELEWQPAPGMNTIGMLLAHIAIVEVWWVENALRGIAVDDVDFEGHLGIGRMDDGIPLSPGGRHPQVLSGRKLAFYRHLLARGRANLRAVAKTLTPKDLERRRHRIRRDGKVHVYNARWVLYHLLEHLAGHYGQILMLRHAYRVRGRLR